MLLSYYYDYRCFNVPPPRLFKSAYDILWKLDNEKRKKIRMCNWQYTPLVVVVVVVQDADYARAVLCANALDVKDELLDFYRILRESVCVVIQCFIGNESS